MGPYLGNQGKSSLTSDSRTLVVTGWDSVGTLFAGIDVHSGGFRWALRPNPFQRGLKFYLPTFAVPSLDARRLYYGQVDSGDVGGFVSLTLPDGEVDSFRPILVGGSHPRVLTAGQRYPPGTFTLQGILSPGPQVARIMFLSPSLDIIDSMSIPDFARNVALTADESTVYYMSGHVLARADLASRTVIRRIPLRGHWFIAVHPDGNSVYAQELAASGASGLLEFTPDLTVRRSIPLQQPEDHGWAPVVIDMVMDPSGQTAFVLTGLTDPFYYVEPAAVRIVDLPSGLVTSVIRFHEDGMNTMHLIWP